MLRNPLAVFSCFFFVAYQWSMITLMYAGRQMPPINDSFYYVFRISRAMDGAFINDTSILYTYSAALLGGLFGLDSFGAFWIVNYAGTLLIAFVLWQLFVALSFPPGLFALSFFLLGFYCNIGPHTFLHFVPSTLSVTLFLFWIALVSRNQDRRGYFWPLVAVNLLMILAHSSGMYVVTANGALLLLWGLMRKKVPIGSCIASPVAIVVGYLLFRWLPFEPLVPAFDVAKWVEPDALERYFAAAGGWNYEFRPFGLLVDEAQISPFRTWINRLNGFFFNFVFPVRYSWMIVIPALVTLLLNSFKNRHTKPYLGSWLFFLAVYFVLFVVMAFFNERGGRLVEFVMPLAFIALAVLLYDVRPLLLRAVFIFGLSSYLFFLSSNFTYTINVDHRALPRLPQSVLKLIGDGVAFTTDSLTAAYLLSNSVYGFQNLYLIPYMKRLENKFYLVQLAACETQDSPPLLRRLYRKLTGNKPNSTITESVLNYAEPVSLSYQPIFEADCLRVSRISFQEGN